MLIKKQSLWFNTIFDLIFAIKQMPVSFDNNNKSYKLTSILQVIIEIKRNLNS